MTEFESIGPYTDEEAVKALRRISHNPALIPISKYLFPELPAGALAEMLRRVNSIDEFQNLVMIKAISAVLAMTSDGMTWEGVENLQKLGDKKFLLVSNHRDIIMDPALVQWVLRKSRIPMTEICVGSNLLTNQIIEDLMRSNRMITVIRGISARELYLSSQILSKYIRTSVTTGRSSVWIAQKEGRTKNGMDRTEQGLLKMFDMSGEGTFSENFQELNIIPVSISYELESCDARKTRELYISKRQKYVKKKNEDLHSILTGIRQDKGRIHLVFGEPLSKETIDKAAEWKGNDRYQAIRHAVDREIIKGYKLWPNNYIALDLLNGDFAHGSKYTLDEMAEFKKYMNHKLDHIERKFDRAELQDIFLHIYANPVIAKENPIE